MLQQSQKVRHKVSYPASHQSSWGKGEVQMQKEWLNTQIPVKVSESLMPTVSHCLGKSPPQTLSAKKHHLPPKYKSPRFSSALNYNGLKQEKWIGNQWIYTSLVKNSIHPTAFMSLVLYFVKSK